MKLWMKIVGIVGLLIVLFETLRKLVNDSGKAFGDVTADLEAWFGERATGFYVPAGPNQEVVDYWESRNATAAHVAQAVRDGITLPFFGLMTYDRGYSWLTQVYMSTTEETIFGNGGGFLGLGKNDTVWNGIRYNTAKEWATEQLELYVSWGSEFGYNTGGAA